jgi:thioredoxin-dependent peroxiredoxin
MNLQALIVLTLVASMLIGTVVMVFNTGGSQSNTDPEHPVALTTATSVSTTLPSSSPVAGAEESGYERLTLLNKGNLAPNFKTVDASGTPVSLEQYTGKHGLVVVFYQGEFCSVCAAQLAGIQAKLSEFKAKGVQVLAVSADEKAGALKRRGESGLTFPVIPDPQRKLISAFGATNHARSNIAYPTVYFIDKQGKVADVYADPQMQRLQAAEMLTKIDALNL